MILGFPGLYPLKEVENLPIRKKRKATTSVEFKKEQSARNKLKISVSKLYSSSK